MPDLLNLTPDPDNPEPPADRGGQSDPTVDTTAETIVENDLWTVENAPLLCGPVTAPDDKSGWFMVLWAKVPDQGVQPEYRHRPDWQEIGYFPASSRDVARARAIEHDGRSPVPIDERGQVARYLIDQAREHGIMLRAVAAEYWPDSTPVTTMYVPDPVLKLG